MGYLIKMTFESYKNKVDRKWRKFRSEVTNPVAQEERNRFYQIYIAYTNKQLVIATWTLAIATIFLSILTLIMK